MKCVTSDPSKESFLFACDISNKRFSQNYYLKKRALAFHQQCLKLQGDLKRHE